MSNEHPIPADNHAWKTASRASLSAYFESFLVTAAGACAAAMGPDWRVYRTAVSNTELYGSFIMENAKSKGQITVAAAVTNTAVKLKANVILMEGRFDLDGGGSVFVDANDMGRGMASQIHKHITRMNPGNHTVL